MVTTFSDRSVNHHDRDSCKKAGLPMYNFEGGAPTSYDLYYSLCLPFWMGSAPDSKATNPYVIQ